MPYRNTSLEVYKKEVKPNLSSKQQVVLDTIRRAKRPVNNQEIAIQLGQPINTVTPRTFELVAKGKVVEAFRAIYPVTNRKVIYWRVA